MAEDYPKHDYVMEREGLHKVCPFKPEIGQKDPANPHYHEDQSYHQKKIYDSILDAVGNTPLIRINNITKMEGIKCEILAKCEFLNPGGSVKDRIGRRMVLDAEREGVLKPGCSIMEPTSGNTGLGLTMAASAKGYKTIIAMPEKMSAEKRAVLGELGAEIIRTPNHYGFDHAHSHIGLTVAMSREDETIKFLDQYRHPGNPLSHYDGTGQEIWDQCEGKLDYVVLTTGTAGTLTGVARKLKEKDPNIQVIAVDPIGSILAEPSELNVDINRAYEIEGTGYDFIPRVCDRSLVDKWLKSEDAPGFEYARKLHKYEGFLCGGSSGSAMEAAMKIARDLPEGKRVVVVFPDNIRNYLTKFVNNDWMYEKGFISEQECTDLHTPKLIPLNDWGKEYTVKDLKLTEAVFLSPDTKIGEAIDIARQNSHDQFPVKNADGQITGMITRAILTDFILKRKVTMDDPVSKAATKNEYRNVSENVPLIELGRILAQRYRFVFVEKKYVVGVQDLLDFMQTHP